MLFITEKRPDLRIYSRMKGIDIRFEGGRYETTDPREIAVLERNRYVTNFTEDVERPLSESSPLDNPLGWQANLEDDESARDEYVDRDLSRWDEAKVKPDDPDGEDESDADRPAAD